MPLSSDLKTSAQSTHTSDHKNVQDGIAPATKPALRRKIALLSGIFLVWLFFDQLVKMLLVDYPQGSVLTSVFFGLIDIRIVFNTGAAWGIFAGNPLALALVSLAVCALLLIYFVWDRTRISYLQIVGIGLVLAGGIGNAIDRFTRGYVLDYLSTSFMDFPVFNLADIGVTCGIVLLFAGMIYSMPKGA